MDKKALVGNAGRSARGQPRSTRPAQVRSAERRCSYRREPAPGCTVAHFNPATRRRTIWNPATSFTLRSCLTCGLRQLRIWISPSASRRSDNGRRSSGQYPKTAPSSCDGLRGPVGRPGGVPERGPRRGLHYPGFEAEAAHWLIELHRRSRDRHDGNRPGRRHDIPRQPAAPSGPSHPSGKPGGAQRDAADRWVDHHRRNPDPGRPRAPQRLCSG
jgi:hypothetical protein